MHFHTNGTLGIWAGILIIIKISDSSCWISDTRQLDWVESHWQSDFALDYTNKYFVFVWCIVFFEIAVLGRRIFLLPPCPDLGFMAFTDLITGSVAFLSLER